MFVFFLRAYLMLIRFDLYLARRDFDALHKRVSSCRVKTGSAAAEASSRICSAMDLACIWYWKEVFCLQRSAATVCLLRHFGVSAQMVIGAQRLPFKAHAWVEVDGRVINDKPYAPEMYAVLDRC
jgi:Transglutaminase-like superfamily